MYSILLVIIYIAFISLGLPDSILGSAWPTMYQEIHAPVSYMGIVTMIISGGTIVSSMNSDRFITKLGTGLVTAISVAMTAVALLGFSVSGSFVMLCVWAIPLGLGAGSVDAALNNFVALHYKSRHMSWLHCFWGVGATLGPYIMGFCLTGGWRWTRGYQIIGGMQTVLVLVLFATLFLWKGTREEKTELEKRERGMKFGQILKISGAKYVLIAFFCYCSVESTAGIWASSYMVLQKGIDAKIAAKWASLFYLGITGGRFLCGFIADRVGDKNMIRLGQVVNMLGIATMFLPFGVWPSFIGLIMIGLGCAPVYPSLIHETPKNFGPEKSQAIMGVQMACAYVGSTFVPPLFGVIADAVGIWIYPAFLLVVEGCMIVMSEKLHARAE